MTPKEKANELVDIYLPWTRDWDIKSYAILNAKQCALIAVEFARENPLNTNGYKKYLQEVKNEINKL